MLLNLESVKQMYVLILADNPKHGALLVQRFRMRLTITFQALSAWHGRSGLLSYPIDTFFHALSEFSELAGDARIWHI